MGSEWVVRCRSQGASSFIRRRCLVKVRAVLNIALARIKQVVVLPYAHMSMVLRDTMHLNGCASQARDRCAYV